MATYDIRTTQEIIRVTDIDGYTIENGNLYLYDKGLSIPTLIFNKRHWVSVESFGGEGDV